MRNATDYVKFIDLAKQVGGDTGSYINDTDFIQRSLYQFTNGVEVLVYDYYDSEPDNFGCRAVFQTMPDHLKDQHDLTPQVYFKGTDSEIFEDYRKSQNWLW